jgi:hypothetical protein
VNAVVSEFWSSYDSGFTDEATFATDDWSYVAADGAWASGRESVLAQARKAHEGALSGVTASVEDSVVQFATSGVAVVTVTSTLRPAAVAGSRLRTSFVAVNEAGRWLMTDTQDTYIQADSAAECDDSNEVAFEQVPDAGEPASDDERRAGVQTALDAFYAAFNSGFAGSPDYARKDWSHIRPTGAWSRGRSNVVADLRQDVAIVNKWVDTPEAPDIRLVNDEVAIVTAASNVKPPDDVAFGLRRTFVVVERGGRWLVMHDHNTAL